MALAIIATLLSVSLAAYAVDVDRDGIIDYVVPSGRSVVAEPIWGNNFGVRDDWRSYNDWNGDGIIDWKDDWYASGERPWSGSWAQADWNRDGVIDSRDGWRRLDSTWAAPIVDNVLPYGTWNPQGAVRRDIPITGIAEDLRYTEGPWNSAGWGAGWNGWNGRTGAWPAGEVVVDDFAYRGAVPAWRGDAIYDDFSYRNAAPAWRGQAGYNDFAYRGAAPAWREEAVYDDWAFRDGLRGDWNSPVARSAPITTTAKKTGIKTAVKAVTKPATTTTNTVKAVNNR
mmetsp:Transcript_19646/g.17371  ORF Transcript_19646/g.17371 Transcript_19646/m.17371 type:complete len:284 (+) Transcript_19646:2-853(+)